MCLKGTKQLYVLMIWKTKQLPKVQSKYDQHVCRVPMCLKGTKHIWNCSWNCDLMHVNQLRGRIMKRKLKPNSNVYKSKSTVKVQSTVQSKYDQHVCRVPVNQIVPFGQKMSDFDLN